MSDTKMAQAKCADHAGVKFGGHSIKGGKCWWYLKHLKVYHNFQMVIWGEMKVMVGWIMDGCSFLGIKLSSVLDWVMGWIWIRLQLNLQGVVLPL
jgi:hypothetical protein